MKTTLSKKIITFILFLGGIFSTQFLNAQNCPSNKVWACRYDACGSQECKCVNASQVQSWMATIPPCNSPGPHHCCKGWRVGQNGTEMGVQALLQVSPNPVSNSTTISFSLDQSQNVSLGIYDVSGRLISTLADKMFNEGENLLTWDTEEINAGVYFMQFQAAEAMQTEKLIVTK